MGKEESGECTPNHSADAFGHVAQSVRPPRAFAQTNYNLCRCDLHQCIGCQTKAYGTNAAELANAAALGDLVLAHHGHFLVCDCARREWSALVVDRADVTVAELFRRLKKQPLCMELGLQVVSVIRKVLQRMMGAGGEGQLYLWDWHLENIGLM